MNIDETLLEKLTNSSELRLHLGEMTAQEMRTAKAAVRYTLAKVSAQIEEWQQIFDNLKINPTHYLTLQEQVENLFNQRNTLQKELERLRKEDLS